MCLYILVSCKLNEICLNTCCSTRRYHFREFQPKSIHGRSRAVLWSCPRSSPAQMSSLWRAPPSSRFMLGPAFLFTTRVACLIDRPAPPCAVNHVGWFAGMSALFHPPPRPRLLASLSAGVSPPSPPLLPNDTTTSSCERTGLPLAREAWGGGCRGFSPLRPFAHLRAFISLCFNF